jgi:hypothetical protein
MLFSRPVKNRTHHLATFIVLALVVTSGCGSAVSHPEPVTDEDTSGGDAIDTTAEGVEPSDDGATDPASETCAESECGPRMGMPAEQCPDGSIGGNTGRCLRRPDGGCGWEVRECPAS